MPGSLSLGAVLQGRPVAVHGARKPDTKPRGMRATPSWRPKALGSPKALQGFCESIGQKWVCQRNGVN